jgi:hypothetical protein
MGRLDDVSRVSWLVVFWFGRPTVRVVDTADRLRMTMTSETEDDHTGAHEQIADGEVEADPDCGG